MAGLRLKTPVSLHRDHIQGREDAPLTLVEYGDYECLSCGLAHSIVRRIQKEMRGDMRFVFRHFPLTQIHPNAQFAAEAAEAAAAQGKFWKMHDLLFENQSALEPADIFSYAEKIGVDHQCLIFDLRNKIFTPRVLEDLQNGLRSGVSQTPTFFINGVRHDRGNDFESLLNGLQIRMMNGSNKAA